MRFLASAALVLSVLVLGLTAGGCGGDGNDDEATWAGPPDPSADGTVAVDGFADFASGVDEHWEGSAAMAAAEFLRLDQLTATRTTIDGTGSAEGTGPETVVVTLDGLLDDSVRAQRWTLTFARAGEVYELTGAQWAQRCRPGRGHQDFSPELCV